MKRLILTFFIALVALSASAGDIKVETLEYIKRDSTLYMDVYTPQDTVQKHLCVIYLFGGGFRGGVRNQPGICDIMKQLAEQGYVAVSIDYRLGLKNFQMRGILDAVTRLQESINMATEDLLAATRFLYDNAERFKIDKNLIVTSGSSAGAITSLQADYYLHSDNNMAHILPDGFNYAGVMSFAGAIARFKSQIKYTSQPAPTLFVHGTKDNLVAYDKRVLFGKGMYGSDYLVDKWFEKNNWPYEIIRYENFGHEIAWLGIKENVPEMIMFINRFVLKQGYESKYGEHFDITIKEKDIKEPIWQIKGLDLYKKDVKATVTKDSVQKVRYLGK